MVQGGSMKKGSSSKGGSSSQKLSDKKMRKMEARVLEEKLVTLRAAVFEPDGKDRNVCAPLAPFMKRVARVLTPSTRVVSRREAGGWSLSGF